MSTLIAISPIALLIYLMTKKKPMPSHKALLIVTVITYALKLFYYKSDFLEVNAAVIDGILTAWTPILVIWGAILLFQTMENTGGMSTIRQWLNGITTNQIAQLMIIGWAFIFLLEGASGFGTPAAIAAPLLVGLGFRPLNVAVMTLIMNCLPTTFGAVGTPLWFGLGQLGLSDPQLLEIGFKSALIHGIAALIIPIIALKFVISFSEIKKNLMYIYLSILSCIVPFVLLARVSYEFPSILGGLIGLILSIILAKKGIGLTKESKVKEQPKLSFRKIIKATFPLWGTVLLLIITRVEFFKLKELLNSTSKTLMVDLGAFAELWISPSLVVQLKDILETGRNFSHAILYVPSFIPFFLISFLTFFIFRSKKSVIQSTWKETWKRMKKPILALLPALVFVKLLLMDGDNAMTIIIGQSLAEWTGRAWPFFSSYLGALGAFFSGSNTVSNLTFGGIQQSIAQNLNLNLTNILATQAVGGAMGNMFCISNIVAVCSVLGLADKEGEILKKTFLPMILYGVIVAGVMVFLQMS